MSWDKQVIMTAQSIWNDLGAFASRMDEACDMARQAASRYEEPEAGWFMADVLNTLNEIEMEEETC